MLQTGPLCDHPHSRPNPRPGHGVIKADKVDRVSQSGKGSVYWVRAGGRAQLSVNSVTSQSSGASTHVTCKADRPYLPVSHSAWTMPLSRSHPLPRPHSFTISGPGGTLILGMGGNRRLSSNFLWTERVWGHASHVDICTNLLLCMNLMSFA